MKRELAILLGWVVPLAALIWIVVSCTSLSPEVSPLTPASYINPPHPALSAVVITTNVLPTPPGAPKQSVVVTNRMLMLSASQAPTTNNLNKVLVWDWQVNPDNPWSNIVFVIRQKPTVNGSWMIAGVTSNLSWKFSATNASEFFTVIASNTATGFVSRP